MRRRLELVRYLQFLGDPKPSDDELIDHDTTNLRATDHEATDRKGANRQCTDRQRTDHDRTYGRGANGGRARCSRTNAFRLELQMTCLTRRPGAWKEQPTVISFTFAM